MIYKPFFQSKATQITVAVDIGHGSDTFNRTGGKGVIVNGVRYEEHDFNSRVAVELNRLLEAIGFKVIMYQKPYSPEIDLNKRVHYYNSIDPDLVWSIHANANSNDEVDGCCAFYWHSNSAMRKLALEFGELVRDAGYHTHGNGTHASTLGSWTNLAITRATTSDAVLTENGFMTNNEPGTNDDFELLFGSKKEEYAREIARIHAIAICKRFGVRYAEENPKPKEVWYRVRKTWADEDSQISAHKDRNAAEKAADARKAEGFVVFNDNGRMVHNPDKYSMSAAERLGEVELTKDANYYVLPTSESYNMRKLPKGHGKGGGVHYYAVKDGFYRLGTGWVADDTLKVIRDYAAEAQQIEEEEDMQDYAVVVNSLADQSAAELLMDVHNAGLFKRDKMEGKVARTLFVVGGGAKGMAEHAEKIIDLSGKDRADTMRKVDAYLDK